MSDDKYENGNEFSRREFLKEAGMIIGGATLVSLTLSASSCGSTGTSTTTDTPASTTVPSTNTTIAPTTTFTTAPTTTTAGTTTLPPTTTPTGTTTHPPTTTPAGTTTRPPTTTPKPTNISGLLDIPGCDTKVASDRVYSLEHVWVKNVGNNTVQIGMSDPFQVMADWVRTLYLPPVGTVLMADTAFGFIQADKMSVDLISPVSGKVLRSHQELTAIPSPINEDPYNGGWMLEIQLSKPEELNKLVAAKYYVYLISSKVTAWIGPIPPMH